MLALIDYVYCYLFEDDNKFFQVLYFEDFSPCSIHQSSLSALTTIDWKSYGLVLGRAVYQGSNVMLEWENLPPHNHIYMVLHRYHKQYPIFHIIHFVCMA